MDNDSKHTSKETKRFMKIAGIQHWITPPQSPDLNPIENLWHELKNYIRVVKPSNKQAFIQAIGKFWREKVTPEKCRKYIDHVVKVLPHVIVRNGQATCF